MKTVFHNPDRQLLSGSVGNVVMPHSERNVIVIPKNATYEVQDKVYAYRVKDNTAESVVIKVAAFNDGNEYIVLYGLENGDVIVTEGVGSLRDGQALKTREDKR